MKLQLIKPKFYIQLFRELIGFIKQPKLEINDTKTVKTKVIETIGLFVIKMMATITIAIVLGLFYEPTNITDSKMAERFTPLIFVLVGGFVLPAFEEITFRLSLKFNVCYASLSITTITYYILTKAVFKTNLSLVDDSFYLRILYSIGIGVLSLIVLNFNSIKKRLNNYWNRNFRFIYYTSCILFAWLHIFNFELSILNLVLLPIITLPQLFSATIAGYTRVAFGFQYPLIIHMFTNTIFISLTFIPLD
ncbi:CAAX protease self-immunity [Lutibacter oricola]|uniref:CAAX protease self-immunity n=1 Tax=Lutibacter oricola TaxID=762486 RepID=A0A1H2SPK6_9FLAO|nr:CPBP family glutamic-type intramembrane protease [Lutibacter oricola]SDW33542.1 CAAX protease self-immunity [Lutibacter oricola]